MCRSADPGAPVLTTCGRSHLLNSSLSFPAEKPFKQLCWSVVSLVRSSCSEVAILRSVLNGLSSPKTNTQSPCVFLASHDDHSWASCCQWESHTSKMGFALAIISSDWTNWRFRNEAQVRTHFACILRHTAKMTHHWQPYSRPASESPHQKLKERQITPCWPQKTRFKQPPICVCFVSFNAKTGLITPPPHMVGQQGQEGMRYHS